MTVLSVDLYTVLSELYWEFFSEPRAQFWADELMMHSRERKVYGQQLSKGISRSLRWWGDTFQLQRCKMAFHFRRRRRVATRRMVAQMPKIEWQKASKMEYRVWNPPFSIPKRKSGPRKLSLFFECQLGREKKEKLLLWALKTLVTTHLFTGGVDRTLKA